MMDFAVPADNRVKVKKVKKRINTSNLLVNWKKHESDDYTNCN